MGMARDAHRGRSRLSDPEVIDDHRVDRRMRSSGVDDGSRPTLA
jgi:hypothetical protein